MIGEVRRRLAARLRSEPAPPRSESGVTATAARLVGLAGTVRDRLPALAAAVEANLPGHVGGSDRDVIEVSGLFDADWYLQQYPDVAKQGLEPLSHFLEQGASEGRSPNSEFDTVYYLQNLDPAELLGRNPLAHYVLWGEREGRRPNAFFDPSYYASRYSDELAGRGALAHYITVRGDHTHSPNAFFDPRFYKLKNPDVGSAGADPVRHFRQNGWKEGRDPSSDFNVRYYIQRYMGSNRSVDPVTLHLEVGVAAGHSTRPTGHEPTPANEIRRFTARGPDFEPEQKPLAPTDRVKAKAIALYLPQFHAFAENDEWWGTGFTEWTNLPRGTPRFLGHYQPRIPRDFGFYDLNDPAVMPRQVEAARKAGIHGFCFYFYSFNGKRLLDMPLEQFLRRREIDFPFSIMWANENWSRRWDGSEDEVLISQDYKRDRERDLIADFVRHFRDPRYIRIGGRPLLSIYRPSLIPKGRESIARWRDLFRELGEEPLIVMAQGFNVHDPRPYGLDGALEFPPHKLVNDIRPIERELEVFDPNFSARVYDYGDLVRSASAMPAPAFPLIRTVAPSWDNDARRQGHGLVLANSTPELFGRWVEDAAAFARRHPFHDEPLIFVNAWNEWAEGAYLEPDVHFGHAYLNSFARAITGHTKIEGKRKVLLVGHDAFPAGSQMLLLNIGRILSRQFGCEVTFALGSPGELLTSYREAGRTLVAEDEAQFERVLDLVRREGYRLCIANTVASGGRLPALKGHDFRVVSLVHELPGIIREKGLEAAAEAVGEHADVCVFATGHIRDGLSELTAISGEVVIRPQGLYTPPVCESAAHAKVRRELKLPKTAKVVLNLGYADLRKGADLFAAVARTVSKARPDVHFVWAGGYDPAVHAWLVSNNDCPNLHFLGARKDVGRLLSAADLFLLTSREDPFPTVVMEALACGVRVLAFEGAGGFVELLEDPRHGGLAPFADVEAMAREVLRELDRDDAKTRRQGLIEDIRTRFAFDDYVFELLRLLEPGLKKISAVVPNYDYARYLPGRLASVFDQAYPLFEVIVLDDASKDESLEVIAQATGGRGRDIRLEVSRRNSGSAFRQWKKGAARARGDFVWIAEADDEADPDLVERLAARAGGDLVFAFADSRAIDGDGGELWADHKPYYGELFAGALREDLEAPADDFARTYLAQRNVILNVSSVLWSRERLLQAFEAVGPDLFSYRFAGDWRLYLQACAAGGRVAYVAQPLNSHRRHGGGLTLSAGGEAQLAEIARVHAAYGGVFGSDTATSRAQKAYLGKLARQFGWARKPSRQG